MADLLRVRDWDSLYENNRTRGMLEMRWVPVPNKLDGDGYTELVCHPNGPAHLGCWLTILQVASKCHPRGTLVRDSGPPHTAASLSRLTRIPAGLFDEVIPRLLAINWLEAAGQDGATIAQAPAVIPQEPAGSTHPSDYGMEGNGMEGNGNTNPWASANANARLVDVNSINNPPFETTEPAALFPVEPAKPVKLTDGLTPQQEVWFTAWWAQYWRHVAKRAARQAFAKHVKSADRFEQIMAATKSQTAEMLSREPGKRPHGATWLTGARWEDEESTAHARTGTVNGGIEAAMQLMAEKE